MQRRQQEARFSQLLSLHLRPDAPPLTVSELSRTIANALRERFPFAVRVVGEVSQVSFSASGHVYFRLKDAWAVVSCVVWRDTAVQLDVHSLLAEGAAVEIIGEISTYVKRSEYQLIVGSIEPVGLGALHRRLEQLKAKLRAQGLFDAARKRPLPSFIQRVAVVTSRNADALVDFIKTCRARGAHVSLLLVHAPVQGEQAAPELARAVRRAGRLDVDAVVLTRGGGSLEDLMAFNTEMVARAIAACERPVISAVGHESDVTIADLVADVRAATPTAAAVLVAAERDALLKRLSGLSGSLRRLLVRRLGESVQALDGVTRALKGCDPRRRLADLRRRTLEARRRLRRSIEMRLRECRAKIDDHAATLRALSPRNTLQRGYAIVFDGSHSVVTDADRTKLGDPLEILLKRGKLGAAVTANKGQHGQDDLS